MNPNRLQRALLGVAGVVAAAFLSTVLRAQAPSGTVLDETVVPGINYDKAEFRLWYPSGAEAVRAILVLVPGSNGDGRAMAEDSVWQGFAVRHHIALIACRFTDKPHEQNFIEEYVDVSKGSGQALLTALGSFAERTGHAELASAPFLMWGMSAGGQFNYEFVAWKPERVVAFVVNKGGIYYSALVPRAARAVPGILFVGGKDLEFRTQTIPGLFAVNRRAGALWALAAEPTAGHIVGRSRDIALMFFEDVLPMRLGQRPSVASAAGALRSLDEKSGFLGDFKAKSFQAMGDAPSPDHPTAWLPSARVARAWQALVSDRPFDP